MQYLNRHIILAGRLLLLLFFLANTGFSVLLTSCTMRSGTACGMTGMPHGRKCLPMASDQSGVPQAAKQTISETSMPCMVTTVAGGLQSEPTNVEKTTSAQQVEKTTALAFVLPVFLITQIPHQSFSLISSVGQSASLLSVEKYVLTCTFLI